MLAGLCFSNAVMFVVQKQVLVAVSSRTKLHHHLHSPVIIITWHNSVIKKQHWTLFALSQDFLLFSLQRSRIRVQSRHVKCENLIWVTVWLESYSCDLKSSGGWEFYLFSIWTTKKKIEILVWWAVCLPGSACPHWWSLGSKMSWAPPLSAESAHNWSYCQFPNVENSEGKKWEKEKPLNAFCKLLDL